MIVIALFLLLIASPAGATVLWSSSAESRTCDVALATNNASAPTFDGATWGFSSAGNPTTAAFPFATVRCLSSTPSIQTPYGSNYIEWLTKCNQALSSGRCSAGGNQDIVTIQAQSDVFPTGLSTVSMGTTYYMGGAFRFDKVGGFDVWLDGAGEDSFDKLMDFRFTGGRWIINAGRDGGFSGNYDGHFMFSFGAATATECPQCGGGSGVGWGSVGTACYEDRKMHNASGYTSSSPMIMDYGHWYNVVLAITLSTNSAVGNAKLYINGTLVTDCNGQTAATGTSSTTGFGDLSLHGTIAQPQYDAPPHYRRVDNMILATSLTDVQNAGLMADPEAGGGGGPPTVTGGRSGGRLVIFVEQAVAYLLLIGQWAMVLGYLWERRAALVRGLVAVHQAYWLIRYRRAVRAWQRAAPVMIEECGGEVVELTKREAVWRQKSARRH